MAKSSTILVATLAMAVGFMVFVISQIDLSIYSQSMHNSNAIGDAPWEILNNNTKSDKNGEYRSNNKMNIIQTGQQNRIVTNDNNIHLDEAILKTSNNNNDHDQSQATTKSIKNSKIKSKTKIVAITDSQYSQIALSWHRKLTSLGYTTHTIAAADDDSLTYLRSQTNISVEPLLHPQSSGWPVARGKPQELRRRIFATRWVYILGQLKLGNHILLTDADNIFVRYMPLEVMEDSEYDVFHAHCGDFPIRFLSMGFVVCGGMAWLRSSEGTVRYVASILEQCGWGGMDEDAEDGDGGAGDGMMMKAKAARCDDQQVVNSKFFFNSLNYTWDEEETRPRLEQGFWKGESSGRSLVTGHRFKLWSVDMCYRGPVNGTFGRCPDANVNWVAMPTNTMTSEKQLDKVRDRKLRVEQWFRFCRNGTSIGDVGFHL
mmetsp:Transcript_29127/g.58184  ORF Transcript_29127/g.58184 Transcript_29127/m.58184 type:complete len:430 (-) Transcript_29127:1257-2546(-)